MDFIQVDTYDLILLFLGVAILIASLFPRFLTKHVVTAPIVYLLLAIIVFIFFEDNPLPGFTKDPYWGKRLTEMGVIISLTSAGLKLRNPFSWRTWQYSFRLLIITMPLTIIAVFFLGWIGLGFAPATAMLLGAVIAPTDPVLASDVQTSSPSKKDNSHTRLALTTEAGLNDGLAFPFTNLAIAMALLGAHPSNWFWDWLWMDFFYKIIAGTLIGWTSGWLLYKTIPLFPKPKSKKLAASIGILSLSLTLIPYGLAEIASSYGFISVFVAACVFRNQEKSGKYLETLHDFSEEMEKILIVVLFSLVGIYLSHEFIDDFQWYMVPTAFLVVMLIRPISGYLALIQTPLPQKKRWIIAFFGIRGIGSLYYVLYAFNQADFEQQAELFALLLVIIVFSLLIHGLSAKAVFDWLLKKNN
ncbi:cation:proton antiporter [Cecembia sp.]|uniref:cation:proton antiporter n=1 Tax=Cecembia sp. TaxID=1898110 RepID=UPI0025C5FC63|nr:cation:proton antiporter [Cecembia sp.]